MSFTHIPAVAAVLAALTLAACQREATTSSAGAFHAPAFSASGSQFGDFEPLSHPAACVAPPTTLAAFATYQPFVLPAGYAQRILADEVTDFGPVAGAGAKLPALQNDLLVEITRP